jgi:hypothetical protein
LASFSAVFASFFAAFSAALASFLDRGCLTWTGTEASSGTA